MTRPAFTSLIAINTPSLTDRTRQLTATTLEVEHHVEELQQVAADLRIERTLGAPEAESPNRFRLALGTALVSLGSAVAGPRAQVRTR